MKTRILYLLLLAVLISACSLFQSDSFAGKWKMMWKSQSQSEEWEFVVAEDNSFTTDYTFFMQGEPLPIDFEGSISEEGAVTAKILFEGRSVGNLKGNTDFEKGEGTWRGGNFSGTFVMIKVD